MWSVYHCILLFTKAKISLKSWNIPCHGGKPQCLRTRTQDSGPRKHCRTPPQNRVGFQTQASPPLLPHSHGWSPTRRCFAVWCFIHLSKSSGQWMRPHRKSTKLRLRGTGPQNHPTSSPHLLRTITTQGNICFCSHGTCMLYVKQVLHSILTYPKLWKSQCCVMAFKYSSG